MKLTKDLQKLSSINIATFYGDEAILPLYLRISSLEVDKNIFYTDLHNKTSSKCSRVKTYYKYVSNLF